MNRLPLDSTKILNLIVMPTAMKINQSVDKSGLQDPQFYATISESWGNRMPPLTKGIQFDLGDNNEHYS